MSRGRGPRGRRRDRPRRGRAGDLRPASRGTPFGTLPARASTRSPRGILRLRRVRLRARLEAAARPVKRASREARMARARLNSIEIDYEVTGTGPVVLLGHGYGSTRHMWDDQHRALADRWRVVSWGMRGHG